MMVENKLKEAMEKARDAYRFALDNYRSGIQRDLFNDMLTGTIRNARVRGVEKGTLSVSVPKNFLKYVEIKGFCRVGLVSDLDGDGSNMYLFDKNGGFLDVFQSSLEGEVDRVLDITEDEASAVYYYMHRFGYDLMAQGDDFIIREEELSGE